MSVVKINALHVPEGRGADLDARFAGRAHDIDQHIGFESFQLLRPVKSQQRYFVVSTWASEEAHQAWCQGQAGMTHGGTNPIATGADLLEFEVVDL
ncbi:antibiotic biosynthesis monooxygenase [Leifsonia sp. LS-T14]|uniref:antibiotic biosynthesis monooxygenase family protein n=1 Tax=unclassified Leifsonia TaxID=2663824 RepID=UPI0035A6DB11